jgi:hypothetical protein
VVEHVPFGKSAESFRRSRIRVATDERRRASREDGAVVLKNRRMRLPRHSDHLYIAWPGMPDLQRHTGFQRTHSNGM